MRMWFLTICTSLLLPSVTIGAEKKPNIIFILTDDQGYSDVGFTNPDTPFVTTNIDKLAESSVKLDNYYVHPTCTPTRAALMTGRYAANVGLGVAFVPGNPGGLLPQYTTLADKLADQGYTNYLVGKWHLGNAKMMYHPLKRGFHNFFGVLGGGLNSWTKQCGQGRYDLWRDYEPYYDNVTHITDLLNNEALGVVETHAKNPDSGPFFMFLSHTAPHDPLLPAPRHLKKCLHIKNTARKLSCGMVAGIDEGVGKIVETLKRHNMLDNTIIAYSHDNGGVPYAGALNYPLRGAKATAYEGGVKSPGFIHAPKLLPTTHHTGLFHVSDYLPTLLSLVSRMSGDNTTNSDNDKLDGVDQVDALVSGSSARDSVHIHRDFALNTHIYRKGDWKLIVGHHSIPFIFPQVYQEPADGWIIDEGSLTGRIVEMLLTLTNIVIGQDNFLFLKYVVWFRTNAYLIGGFKNFPFFGGPTDIYREPFKTDLETFMTNHTDKNPKVSLFNLKTDPQEVHNVADHHPDLVKQLLAEAESQVKDAPAEVVGNLIEKNAPSGPQSGTWWDNIASLGAEHSQVVPFGPYLEDSVDIVKLEYSRGFMENMGALPLIFIVVKVFVALIILLVLPILVVKCFFR